MRGVLKYIDLENFKSYKGKIRIGSFKQFMAVIGPNGSGKSNFMDAISFVMGEKSAALRVKRLNHLIHGASVGRPISSTASVTAVMGLEDGAEKRFTRIIHGSSSEYRIDDEVVGQQQYAVHLEALGINVKAKNFLIFQGAVETIAMKNPKERMALFEEISGSGALKETYEKTKTEMLKAEEDIQTTYSKKKGLAAESKEAKSEKEEAEKFQRLKDDYRDKEIEFNLFNLNCIEEDIHKIVEDLGDKQEELHTLESKKSKQDSKLKDRKRELGNLNREFAVRDSKQREKERELNARRPEFIKAKENVTHIKKKLETGKKSLDQALKARVAHENDIDELRKQIKDVEVLEQEYLVRTANESQSQSQDITLQDNQLREYWELKKQVQERSKDQITKLDDVNRLQKDDQEVFDGFQRQKSDLDGKMRQLTHEISESTKRVEKLGEQVDLYETTLENHLKTRDELKSEVNTAKDKLHDLHNSLEDVNLKLGDAHVDKHEYARRKKKQEIVETFQNHFHGVYNRMINMCNPRHPKYNIAVTKVMGKYMEAIVVDSTKTAQSCIQYLKEQMLEPETFLPLDTIEAKPVRERLRNIQDPPNVRLIYDILEFPKPIEKAVLFCTNNALVCETQDDANRVAYDLEPGQRFDAVALDGTFFTRSGIMSGGTQDLMKKARRWDEKLLSKLKADKDRISEEFREAIKTSRKESELSAVEQQIQGLVTRSKYAKNDKDSTTKQVEKLVKQKEDIKKDLIQVNASIKKIEGTIAQRDENIQSLKTSLNSIEDECFRSFCKHIGVKNIRQYEEGELRTKLEREQKLLEFQKQKELIQSQMDFEVSRAESVAGNVSRWETTVSQLKETLSKTQVREKDVQAFVDRIVEQHEVIKKDVSEMKAEIKKKDEQIQKAKREVGEIAKEIQSTQKVIRQMEAKQDSKRNERHNILKTCLINGIVIPTLSGSLNDAAEGEGSHETFEVDSDLSTQELYNREARLKIDYSRLPEELKSLTDSEKKEKSESLARHLKELNISIKNIQAPHMNASQRLESLKEKVVKTNELFENARKKVKSTKLAFESVKSERCTKFMLCYEHVANCIDDNYKGLTQSPSSQAILGLENLEEPYLEGITYNCIPPGKRFQAMDNLSGGEKTLAALALLFAIHSYNPAPFFVLDEIDAALDATNIGKVASFIQKKTSDLQIIVISLKNEFYGNADALVGVAQDSASNEECVASCIYLLDLEGYPIE